MVLRFRYSAVSWVISFVEVSRSAFEVRTVLIGRAKIFLPDAARRLLNIGLSLTDGDTKTTK